MRSLVFPLALLLVIACGSSKNKKSSPDVPAGPQSDGRLKTVYEVREQDGGALVGVMFRRDHGNGRIIYWVEDRSGNTRGFIAEKTNRAYAYDFVLGQRSESAEYIGSDTIKASARRILGHDRVVVLVKRSPKDWARHGVKPDGAKSTG
jgi:hypothetical protein